MIVGLKVPDTTAKTALQAYKDQGLKEVCNVHRWTYFEFEHDGESKAFANKISKVDILVNANKNNFKIFASKDELRNEVFKGMAGVLVSEINDKAEGLVHTLRDRLGIIEVKAICRGVLWGLEISGDKHDATERAAKNLLYNPHYQTYEVLL